MVPIFTDASVFDKEVVSLKLAVAVCRYNMQISVYDIYKKNAVYRWRPQCHDWVQFDLQQCWSGSNLSKWSRWWEHVLSEENIVCVNPSFHSGEDEMESTG